MPFKSGKQRKWMHKNKPGMAKKWEAKEMAQGGYLSGPSHEAGGIPIMAEGGEFIIKNDSVNPETEAVLEHINEFGEVPISDARNRNQVFREGGKVKK